MHRYQLLMTLQIEHGYFSDSICRSVSIALAPESRQQLDAMQGISRPLPGRLELYYREDYLDCAETMFLGSKPAQLSFILDFDAQFSNYTAGGLLGRQYLTVGAGDCVLEEDGRIRLHQNVECNLSELPMASRYPQEWGRKAAGIDLTIEIPVANTSLPLPNCVLRLAARKTQWKYLFIGLWHNENMRIVDSNSDEPIEFTPGCTETLANGQSAIAIRSTTTLDLTQQSRRHFELRQFVDGIDKIMVKRLPVANHIHFNREVRDGVATLISEIYVHC